MTTGEPPKENLEIIRLILVFLRASARNKISLQDMVEGLGERSHLLLITVLILPYLQPIPLPGLSVLSGTLLALVAVRAMMGRPPWIPRRYRDLSFSQNRLIEICENAGRWSMWIHRFTKPRLTGLTKKSLHQVSYVLIILSGLELALPLPIPGTNTLPAVNILFFAVGLLEEDGLLILLGMVLSAVSVVVFSAILILPFAGIHLFRR